MLGLLAGAAVTAGVFGAKKGKDALKDTAQAKELLEDAESIFNRSKDNLEKTREKTQLSLERLGATKLQVWDKEFGRFVELFLR